MDTKLVVDTITGVATAVIALTGIVALGYAARQLKQAREAEKVKHLVEFNREFESEPMANCRRVVAQKRLARSPFPDEAHRLLGFFETMGLLVRRGYLDESDVWSTFSCWIFNIYADFRGEIEQEQRGDASYYCDFCALAERLRVLERQVGGGDDRPSPEEIRDFWEEETNIAPGSPIRRRKPKDESSAE